MSANFDVVGRRLLAGYAGAAGGILRGRIHPLVPVAAIDVLAVALALGAMNVVGTMISGYRESPFAAAIDRVKDDVTNYPAVTAVPTVPKPAVTPVESLTLVPNAELLFAPPVVIGTSFETGNTGDTVRFVVPVDVANSSTSGTNAEEGQPAPEDIAATENPRLPLADPTPGITSDPASPPVAKILSIAGVGHAKAVALARRASAAVANLTDKILDTAPLQTYSGPGTKMTASATTAAPAVTSAASTVAAQVQVAPSVRQVAQSATQPIAKLAGGLLN